MSQWHLDCIHSGVITFCPLFCLHVWLFFLELFRLPSFLCAKNWGIQQWRKCVWPCPLGACDLQGRRANFRSHCLCIITTVIRAVRVHDRCCPGASGKAPWSRKAGVNWSQSERCHSVAHWGEERKAHSFQVEETVCVSVFRDLVESQLTVFSGFTVDSTPGS